MEFRRIKLQLPTVAPPSFSSTGYPTVFQLPFVAVAFPPIVRTLLVLGRASNLPTVWSNCLAGYLLGGSGSGWRFLLLCLGGSLAYTGGMYLAAERQKPNSYQ